MSDAISPVKRHFLSVHTPTAVSSFACSITHFIFVCSNLIHSWYHEAQLRHRDRRASRPRCHCAVPLRHQLTLHHRRLHLGHCQLLRRHFRRHNARRLRLAAHSPAWLCLCPFLLRAADRRAERGQSAPPAATAAIRPSPHHRPRAEARVTGGSADSTGGAGPHTRPMSGGAPPRRSRPGPPTALPRCPWAQDFRRSHRRRQPGGAVGVCAASQTRTRVRAAEGQEKEERHEDGVQVVGTDAKIVRT